MFRWMVCMSYFWFWDGIVRRSELLDDGVDNWSLSLTDIVAGKMIKFEQLNLCYACGWRIVCPKPELRWWEAVLTQGRRRQVFPWAGFGIRVCPSGLEIRIPQAYSLICWWFLFSIIVLPVGLWSVHRFQSVVGGIPDEGEVIVIVSQANTHFSRRIVERRVENPTNLKHLLIFGYYRDNLYALILWSAKISASLSESNAGVWCLGFWPKEEEEHLNLLKDHCPHIFL